MEGKDPFSLTVDDLAAVDEFHSRGRRSTVELANLAGPGPTDRILDVGCGLGGSARFLANEYGCRVVGIDLTTEYVQVAQKLTDLVRLNDQCTYVIGTAIDLPFEDACFDVVWTEHAQMNIRDKHAFYHEITRVLKPGGRFVFHDVFAGVGDPEFPLPWADRKEISYLCEPQVVREFLQDTGLRISDWNEAVNETVNAFEQSVALMQSNQTPALGIHLLMGETAEEKVTNYLQGLRQEKITVAMGRAVK